MKLYLILSEDINITKHQAQLDAVQKRTKYSTDEIVDFLNYVDESGKYTKWLLRQLRFSNITIDDKEFARDTILDFRRAGSRLNTADIMQYKTIQDLRKALDDIGQVGSKRSGSFQINVDALPGVQKISENDGYVLYDVSDVDSLADMGHGTKWCTRRDFDNCESTESYIRKYGHIYIAARDGVPVYQITPNFSEITTRKNKKAKNFDPNIIEPIADNLEPDQVFNMAQIIGRRWEDKEHYLLVPGAAQTIIKYIQSFRNYQWPEAEPILAQDSDAATDYAIEVIRERFLRGEPAILKDTQNTIDYLKAFFKNDRWPQAEPILAQDALVANVYAQTIGKRFRLGEPTIMKDPDKALFYAERIIGGPWPEAEPFILKNPVAAAKYAANVLKRKWPEAEPTLLKSLESLIGVGVIKEYLKAFDGPWPDALRKIKEVREKKPALAKIMLALYDRHMDNMNQDPRS